MNNIPKPSRYPAPPIPKPWKRYNVRIEMRNGITDEYIDVTYEDAGWCIKLKGDKEYIVNKHSIVRIEREEYDPNN